MSQGKKILVGVKKNNTFFFKVIKNLMSKKQENLMSITASSFSELLNNIVKDYKKIENLKLPPNIAYHNGWRDSQRNIKKAKRVDPLTKDSLEEIKLLLSNYFIKIEVEEPALV